MAPSPRTGSRQDATALPSMSSTFWAFMILASLLIAYCSQLAAGTCEIVTLDRDSSQPRRTIARQTARCACRKGQIAGTTRARPACVDARIIKTKQWCDMLPCLEGEGCDLLINRSGWTCTQPGGRIKTTTRAMILLRRATHSSGRGHLQAYSAARQPWCGLCAPGVGACPPPPLQLSSRGT
ncbi:PREDICTED: protein FAM19A5 isoform X6 [Cercocebus atys]|uniref:protein FAM19A5 isoform X6 n=1 Tax=Cercocebus atys TaxID=9531 RepID=UPI0005F4C16A|nr:PREDICTED: protein FAM19A5 isoform X6 [Cercocebus atys]